MVRPAATSDDATPNPNAIAAQNLVRLAALTGDAQWREQADRLFDGVLAGAADNLLQHAALLNALDLRLHAAEIVVTGPRRTTRFAAAALKLPYLSRIVLRAPRRRALAGEPSGAGQDRRAGAGSAAFVCVGETCSLPVTDPDRIADVVGAMRPAAAGAALAVLADVVLGAGGRGARAGRRTRAARCGGACASGMRRAAPAQARGPARRGGCRRPHSTGIQALTYLRAVGLGVGVAQAW